MKNKQSCSDHDYKVFARRGLVSRLGWNIKYDAIHLMEGSEHIEEEKPVVDAVTFNVIKNSVLCEIHWNGVDMIVNGVNVPAFIVEVEQ